MIHLKNLIREDGITMRPSVVRTVPVKPNRRSGRTGLRRSVLAIMLAAGLVGSVVLTMSASTAVEKATTHTTAQVHMRPLNILLTNDDGWRGPGGSTTPLIRALRDALAAAGHHVVVVAPGTDQSGQGSRITVPPLQLTVANPEPDVWTVSPGSPSDTVFFAMDQIFGSAKPDLVVSGINPGNNMGQAVHHSGTVNAAITAPELGVPSMAVSLQTPTGWPGGLAAATPAATEYVVRLVDRLQREANRGPLMPEGVSLNVNLPLRPGPIDPTTGLPASVLPPKGERVTSVSSAAPFQFDYQNTTGQPGSPGVYSIQLIQTGVDTPARGGSDIRAIRDGYISVTPLEADRDVDAATQAWLRKIC
jgi:5'-nucleotidase